MSKRSTKVKPGVTKTEPKHKVPQTPEEAMHLIAVIGEARRIVTQESMARDAQIAALGEAGLLVMTSYLLDIAQAFMALKAYAEARRNELTNHGQKKTIETAAGTFGWKDTPPALHIKDEDEVIKKIEALEDKTLKESLLRRKTEINKDALKQNEKYALSLPGVEIKSSEEFRVKPKDDTKELTQSTIDQLLKKAS